MVTIVDVEVVTGQWVALLACLLKDEVPLRVDAPRDRLKVRGIATGFVPTQVVKLEPARNGPNKCLVRGSMREKHAAVVATHLPSAVANTCLVPSTSPDPAVGKHFGVDADDLLPEPMRQSAVAEVCEIKLKLRDDHGDDRSF